MASVNLNSDETTTIKINWKKWGLIIAVIIPLISLCVYVGSPVYHSVKKFNRKMDSITIISNQTYKNTETIKKNRINHFKHLRKTSPEEFDELIIDRRRNN